MEFKLKYAVVEITKICNLRCVHCGSGCTDTLGKELSIDDWKRVILELSKLGVEKIVFSGGEPTLKREIEKLFAQICNLGIDYGIITNGLNLTDEMIKSFVRYKPFAVGFSVDGLEETHNKIRQNHRSWQNCMESIMRVKEAGIGVCIVTTLNRWNYRELKHLVSFVNLVNADCWQLQLTFPAGRAKNQKDFLVDEKEFATIFEQIAKFRKEYPDMKIEAADCFAFAPQGLIRDDPWGGCQAGITSMGIDALGNVMPCLAMRSAAYCGNVTEKPLKEIWENSGKFDFNRSFDPNSVVGKCRNCQILNYCRGGCGSFSLSYNGYFYEAPFCYFREVLKKETKGGQ